MFFVNTKSQFEFFPFKANMPSGNDVKVIVFYNKDNVLRTCRRDDLVFHLWFDSQILETYFHCLTVKGVVYTYRTRRALVGRLRVAY